MSYPTSLDMCNAISLKFGHVTKYNHPCNAVSFTTEMTYFLYMYLFRQVREDGTIWFDLDCMTSHEDLYCGFGFSETDTPAGGGPRRQHDTDIYTAHRDKVEDM